MRPSGAGNREKMWIGRLLSLSPDSPVELRERRLAFVDLLCVAEGMHGNREEILVAVHGSDDRMCRDSGTKVCFTAFDKAKRAFAGVEEMVECLSKGRKPSDRSRHLRGFYGLGAVQALGQDQGFPLFVHHGSFRRTRSQDLHEEVILGGG